jgi:hypothetical protein
MAKQGSVQEGQVLVGSLFNEPMRVETVRALPAAPPACAGTADRGAACLSPGLPARCAQAGDGRQALRVGWHRPNPDTPNYSPAATRHASRGSK